MTAISNTSVVRNDAAERYEVVVDHAEADPAEITNTVAAYVAFYESETHIVFTHTEVADAYRGQGVASLLADAALTDAVARDLTIIPVCPYMARHLEHHTIEGARVEWPNRAPRS